MEQYYILIQAGIVLLVFLMATFTAKRFNFIHGAITLLAIITFISGVSAVFSQYALDGGKELGYSYYNLLVNGAHIEGVAFLKGVTGMEAFVRYLIFFTAPLQLVANYFVQMIFAFDIPEAINDYLWIVLFVPTVLWLVSRIISGIVRR